MTQHEGSRAPFHNAYWNNHQPGLYVDVISGEPLFELARQVRLRHGLAQLTRPLDPAHVKTHADRRLLLARAEVRSRGADSHLGARLR